MVRRRVSALRAPLALGRLHIRCTASPRNLRLRLSLGELLAAFFPMKTDEIGTVLTVTGEMEGARVCEWAPPSHGITVFARLWGPVSHGEI